MRIEQSTVAMSAGHDFTSESEFRIDSASSFRTVFAGVSQASGLSTSAEADRQAQLLLRLEALIARLLEFISGHRDSPLTDLREVLQTNGENLPDSASSRPQRVVEMEWQQQVTESIREHERTDFTSTGTIRTADGRSLDFRLDLTMCRDFACEKKSASSDKIVLRDPLVINFDGKAAELSGQHFAFDLDADGTAELIKGLGSSSAYLAIDSNADGRINDGSELFGTCSGNGFADLAKLDDDGNHWLDEADAAFDTLRLWQRDASGQDNLGTLRDRGIGALYLGSTETPFALTDTDNRLLGQIRASGFYLREDGRAGSLQQVDLAV